MNHTNSPFSPQPTSGGNDNPVFYSFFYIFFFFSFSFFYFFPERRNKKLGCHFLQRTLVNLFQRVGNFCRKRGEPTAPAPGSPPPLWEITPPEVFYVTFCRIWPPTPGEWLPSSPEVFVELRQKYDQPTLEEMTTQFFIPSLRKKNKKMKMKKKKKYRRRNKKLGCHFLQRTLVIVCRSST